MHSFSPIDSILQSNLEAFKGEQFRVGSAAPAEPLAAEATQLPVPSAYEPSNNTPSFSTLEQLGIDGETLFASRRRRGVVQAITSLFVKTRT